MNKDVKY